MMTNKHITNLCACDEEPLVCGYNLIFQSVMTQLHELFGGNLPWIYMDGDTQLVSLARGMVGDSEALVFYCGAYSWWIWAHPNSDAWVAVELQPHEWCLSSYDLAVQNPESREHLDRLTYIEYSAEPNAQATKATRWLINTMEEWSERPGVDSSDRNWLYSAVFDPRCDKLAKLYREDFYKEIANANREVLLKLPRDAAPSKIITETTKSILEVIGDSEYNLSRNRIRLTGYHVNQDNQSLAAGYLTYLAATKLVD